MKPDHAAHGEKAQPVLMAPRLDALRAQPPTGSDEHLLRVQAVRIFEVTVDHHPMDLRVGASHGRWSGQTTVELSGLQKAKDRVTRVDLGLHVRVSKPSRTGALRIEARQLGKDVGS